MELNKKELSLNYKAVKAREYNLDNFKCLMGNIRSNAYHIKNYAENEDVRQKKKEYNKMYWAKKQLAKTLTA